MKQTTRDNLIYLAVGLGVAMLVVVDVVYSESRGKEMWWPSKFSFRLVYSTALLAYFVIRETHKTKATLVRVVTCLLFVSIVHLGIVFGFHQTVGQLPGLTFAALAMFELFFLVQVALFLERYLRPDERRTS